MATTTSDKVFDMCLKEMFKRVGRTLDENFIRKDRWWCESRWTEEEENGFRDWMVKLLRKKKKWTKKMSEGEVSWFLFSYSWKYVPEGCMKIVDVKKVR